MSCAWYGGGYEDCQGSYQQPRLSFQQHEFQPWNSNYQPPDATWDQPSQDFNIKTMLQSILEGQAREQLEMESKFSELQAKINQVTSVVVTLEDQMAQVASCNSVFECEEDEALVKAIRLRSGKELPTGEASNVEKTVEENDDLQEVEPPAEEVGEKAQDDSEVTQEALRKLTFVPPPYEPKVPFPGRVKKQLLEKQRKRFMDIMDDVMITIPLLETIKDNPTWKKFFKDLVTRKKRMDGFMISEGTSQPQAPPTLKTLVKKGNPGKFNIPCSLGGRSSKDALCDSGALVNVISWELVKELNLKGMKPSSTSLVFGDASKKTPKGIIEDYPIMVGNCIIPTDLLVLDMGNSKRQPIILGAPFLLTAGAIINYDKGVVVLKNVNEEISYAIVPPHDFCGTLTTREAFIGFQEEATVETAPFLAATMFSVETRSEFEAPLKEEAASPGIEAKQKVEIEEIEKEKSVEREAPSKEEAASQVEATKAVSFPDLGDFELERLFKDEVPLQEEATSKAVEAKLEFEVAVGKMAKPTKKKKLEKAKVNPQEPRPPSITLKPSRITAGKLECAVKTNGYSKPFAKARIILDSQSKDGYCMVTAKMANLFGIKLDDFRPYPNGSSHHT